MKIFTTLELIGQILEEFFILMERLFSIFKSKPGKSGYNATFGKYSDVLSYFNKGFCLDGKRFTRLKDALQGAILIGSTGTGKSAYIIKNQLLRAKPDKSFIVVDVSGELYRDCAGYLSQIGFDLRIYNPSSPELSDGFNPLSFVEGPQDYQKIADMLVRNALGQGKDPFWNLSATNMIALTIAIIKEQMPEYLNLANVRHVINALAANPEAVDELFSRTNDQELFEEYKALVATDDKLLSSVIATAKATLNIWSNPGVQRITSTNTISFSDLRKRPTALFIQCNIPDQKYFSSLNALLLEQCLGFFMRNLPDKKRDKPCLILGDEIATLGTIPSLSTAIVNLRKFLVGGLWVIQGYSQLVHNLGKDDCDTIRGNCKSVLLLGGGNQPLSTFQEFSDIIGKVDEYEDPEKKTGKTVRPLFPASEIRLMKEGTGLLLFSNRPAIKLKMHPYFKNRVLRKRSEIPAPVPEAKTPSGKVPLIPLKHIEHEKVA